MIPLRFPLQNVNMGMVVEYNLSYCYGAYNLMLNIPLYLLALNVSSLLLS